MVVESELELYISGCLYAIRENFGIDLIWSEIAGLRQYLMAFCKNAEKDDSILPLLMV